MGRARQQRAGHSCIPARGLSGGDLHPLAPFLPTPPHLPGHCLQGLNLRPHSQAVCLIYAGTSTPITYSRPPPCSEAHECPGEGGRPTLRAGPSPELSQTAKGALAPSRGWVSCYPCTAPPQCSTPPPPLEQQRQLLRSVSAPQVAVSRSPETPLQRDRGGRGRPQAHPHQHRCLAGWGWVGSPPRVAESSHPQKEHGGGG